MLSREMRDIAAWLQGEGLGYVLSEPRLVAQSLACTLEALAESADALESLIPPPASEMEARAAAAESGKLVELAARRAL